MSQEFAAAHEQPWPKKTGVATESEKGKFDRAVHFADGLPEVVVFVDPHFGGAEMRTNLNMQSLGDRWNNKISSIVVVRGKWRFYQEASYKGEYWDLDVGYYPWVETVQIPDNAISSFQCIGK